MERFSVLRGVRFCDSQAPAFHVIIGVSGELTPSSIHLSSRLPSLFVAKLLALARAIES